MVKTTHIKVSKDFNEKMKKLKKKTGAKSLQKLIEKYIKFE